MIEQPVNTYLRFIIIVSLSVLAVSCADKSKRSSSAIRLAPDQKLDFRIPVLTDRTEYVKFHSHTVTKRFEDGQIRHEKEEQVDFTVKIIMQGRDEKLKGVKQILSTVKKDGAVNLHELAFPELGEELEVVLSEKAKVLKAGEYPKDSIFYLPPISLPQEAVEVGDTWDLNVKWISMSSAIPLQLNMITILKGLYRCGKNRCADLEVSGRVGFASQFRASHFDSDISGRLLYSLETGSVLWGYIRNTEKLTGNNSKIEVYSCLESALVEPQQEVWQGASRPDCNPNQPVPEKIPGT